MDRQLLNAIVDKYNKNGKIEAIKRFREVTECSLRDAKDAVEYLVAHGVLPPQPLIVDGQKLYNKTFKKFDIHNLVKNQACTEWLAKLLTYCAKLNLSLYRSFDYFTFRGWWNEEGKQYALWLLDHGYIECKVVGPRFMKGGTCELGPYRYVLSFVPLSVDRQEWVATLINLESGHAWHDAVPISEVERNNGYLSEATFKRLVDGENFASAYVKEATESWKERS